MFDIKKNDKKVSVFGFVQKTDIIYLLKVLQVT